MIPGEDYCDRCGALTPMRSICPKIGHSCAAGTVRLDQHIAKRLYQGVTFITSESFLAWTDGVRSFLLEDGSENFLYF